MLANIGLFFRTQSILLKIKICIMLLIKSLVNFFLEFPQNKDAVKFINMVLFKNYIEAN